MTIEGGGPVGVFYGVQTLRLLLPPDTLRAAPPHGEPTTLELPAVEIEDAPRYSWRGVHLDVARHFFPKSWIIRLIDLIALHKLNVLHLHLTDDQGWRFPVQRYSDRARRRMRALGLRAESQLQGWFMAQAERRLAARGVSYRPLAGPPRGRGRLRAAPAPDASPTGRAPG